MARYYMHLRDATKQILDPEGVEYLSVEVLRKAVLISARDLMTGDIREGALDFRFRIGAEDESGKVVYSLPFKHAIQPTVIGIQGNPLTRPGHATPLRPPIHKFLASAHRANHIRHHDHASPMAKVYQPPGGRVGHVRCRGPVDNRRDHSRAFARSGRHFLHRAGPRAGPEDQHVGKTALCAVQALAAQGGPLDGLGVAAPERAEARSLAQGRTRANRRVVHGH